MPCPNELTFPELDKLSFITHGFSLRTAADHQEITPASEVLAPLGVPKQSIVEASQPHGDHIAKVSAEDRGHMVEDVDALITSTPGVTLVIRTADCAPIYLVDTVHRAIGLVHSGKKGTFLKILTKSIEAMRQAYGTQPDQLITFLGPCIRPPHYEIDFAQMIITQAQSASIKNITDCSENTAQNLNRYYSYRRERGQTGRHYAYLSLKE